MAGPGTDVWGTRCSSGGFVCGNLLVRFVGRSTLGSTGIRSAVTTRVDGRRGGPPFSSIGHILGHLRVQAGSHMRQEEK